MNTPIHAASSGLFRAVSDGLSGPLPQRTLFLTELASDLDALTRRLVAEGHPVEEARRRAAEALVPDETTLKWLDELQAPAYRRLTRDFDGTRLRRLERTGAIVAGLGLLVLEAQVLLRADLLSDASLFLWPVLASGSLLLGTVLAKWFQLWVKRDHRRMRRGLGAIAGLTLTTLGLGFGGVVFDFLALLSTLEADPVTASELLFPALVRGASLAATSILIALAGSVAWLVTSQWIAMAEDAHRRALDLDSTLFKEE